MGIKKFFYLNIWFNNFPVLTCKYGKKKQFVGIDKKSFYFECTIWKFIPETCRAH